MTGRLPAGDGGHSLLPASPTRLVGRERERRAARDQLMLEHVRLLTLTGPGGSGKTRLALAVAEDLAPAFVDGVRLVDLTPLREPSLVVPAIARAFGVHESGRRPIAEVLFERLQTERVLLVLDNCEHLLEAAPAIADLLGACRQVKVLAASREPLALRWEHELPVPPLAVPDLMHPADTPTLGAVPSVQLFVERAQAVDPSFALTDENARAVAELCVRLDGLPLALELAAARTRVLPVEAMLRRLDDGLSVLTSEARDRPARHRTLSEAIRWSYDLLPEDERAAFRRLSIFVGGFSLAAGSSVLGDGGAHGPSPIPQIQNPEPNTLDLVASLVDKSLLRRETLDEGEPRFSMLETIREFAHERLQDEGELVPTARRHAEYYLALAEHAAPRLYTAELQTWLRRLAPESANIRAALTWGRSTPSATVLWTRLATALGWFWWLHDELREGREWLELAVATIPADADSPARLRIRTNALNTAGLLARGQGDYERAIALLDEGLVAARRLGDRREIAWALVGRATVALDQVDPGRGVGLCEEAIEIGGETGEAWLAGLALYFLGFMARGGGAYEHAHACQNESLALRQGIGDPWGIAWSVHDLGLVALGQGDYERAHALLSESLASLRRLNHRRGVAWALNDLGAVALATGDAEGARGLVAEGLTLRREQGDKRGIAESLEYLGAIANARGEPERGARLVAAAAALRDAIGAPLWPIERARLDRDRAASRRALGVQRFGAAWAEGRQMTLESAVAYALADEAVPAAAPSDGDRRVEHRSPLTPREREVAALIARGYANRQIATALVISPHTAERHVEHILARLGLASRAEIAAWATRHELASETA